MERNASACGKAILLGEHAVVYGQPAIAVPLPTLRAYTQAESLPPGSGIVIVASDLGLSVHYPGDKPTREEASVLALWLTVHHTLEHLQVKVPDTRITLHSQLPFARGLGSGAAVAVSLVRVIADCLGTPLTAAAVSEIAYRTEVLHHGHPSGIDNTTIAYEKPVLYQRGQPLRILQGIPPFCLVVADSGIPSQTRTAVEQVRSAWLSKPERYTRLFEHIGKLAAQGLAALQDGSWPELGAAMDANGMLLAELGVSSPELDRLVAAARSGGALGAKLSGSGQGGCIIALVENDKSKPVTEYLTAAGAHTVWRVDINDAYRD